MASPADKAGRRLGVVSTSSNEVPRVQKGQVTCPSSHRWCGIELEFKDTSPHIPQTDNMPSTSRKEIPPPPPHRVVEHSLTYALALRSHFQTCPPQPVSPSSSVYSLRTFWGLGQDKWPCCTENTFCSVSLASTVSIPQDRANMPLVCF